MKDQRLAWGIRFPSDESEWWGGCEPKLPGVSYAFVTLLKDGLGPRIPVDALSEGDLPEGWSSDRAEGELIIGRPLHTFRQDPEGWTNDFAEWIVRQTVLILPVVKELSAKL